MLPRLVGGAILTTVTFCFASCDSSYKIHKYRGEISLVRSRCKVGKRLLKQEFPRSTFRLKDPQNCTYEFEVWFSKPKRELQTRLLRYPFVKTVKLQ
ncbi:hypothetical protein [Thermovibrio ammonificans]|uniref:Uncharacterized protein n=1 Tax=Thermovibrio ammonificans (strain DSM 15698 / JCM 12110 / HB-1) TaxID=648996 RepID=E8T2K0_THEA1|nr:hypothetical protein [Thermovibrio ammonificans]ADU97095.1 hypothetical protein Theam_1129 [Thermovibrio ammonificans HB-1]